MTETPQTPPAPPEDDGQARRPGPVNAPETPGDKTGHALYDKTLKRFVSGVSSTKKDAGKGFARVKGHDYEVREV